METLSNCGGGKRIRTADPLHAMQVLYQLSYTPEEKSKRIRTADPLHAMQVLYQLSYTPEEKTHCIEHLSKNQGFYVFFSF